MRPQFNADTCYLPVHDGVYLRNNNSGLVLKGKSLYPLLAHLVPHLKGDATLAELTEGLDEDRKKMVTKLIEKLLTHHFVKDASQDQLHTLLPAMQETYAADIAFIASFPTAAAAQFEQLRATRLLLIASGSGLAPLVQASLHCGVRRIDVVITPENALNSSFPSDMLDQFSLRDSAQTLHSLASPRWDNEAEVRNLLQPYDAVLHLCDQPLLARAQQLNRLCVAQQKTFLQAIALDEHVWIGPLVCPNTPGCWECAWRRLQANLPYPPEQRLHYALHDQPALTSSSLAAPAAALVANRLVFELFKSLTQTGYAKTAQTLTDFDLKTLSSKRHAFLPHPHCLSCQHPPALPTALHLPAQFQQQPQANPLDPDTLFAHMADCIDETLGLFTEVGDDNFAQAPLAVYRVRLSNPQPTPLASKPLDAVVASVDSINARARACQKACERYAAHFVNQRRLFSYEEIQQQALPVISSERFPNLQAALPASERWQWALDLHTRQGVFVPAARAFPSLRPTEQGAEAERGVASGASWEEAIVQALVDQCHALTVEQLPTARSPYPRVDLARTAMTPEGTYLLHLLEVAGRQIAVYDITGPLEVPTFALCSGRQTVAYSTHCDVAQALNRGLEQVLQQYQAEQYQQPACAIAPVPDLSDALRGDHAQVPRYAIPETWSARQAWLLQRLQVSGLRALAVPLDHDPALQQVLPFIVRVLLTRAEV